jgi:hypothetical protein
MSAYAKVGGEFAVNPEESHDEFGAQITAFADGGYLMTWIERLSNEAGPSQQVVMARRYDVSGGALGEAFVVNQGPPRMVQQATAAEFAGGFVVTWQDHLEDLSGNTTKSRLFDAQGNPLGDEFALGAVWEGSYAPQVHSLSNGGFVVAWDSGWSQKAQIFDAAGVKVGGEIVTNNAAGIDGFGDVTALAGGGFVVSWRAGGFGAYDVYARIFDNAGSPVGAQFRLNTATSGDQYGQSVTALEGGGFVAVWGTSASDSGNWDLRAQLFGATGVKVGAEFAVNQPTASWQNSQQVTALSNGGFLVAWQTGDTAQDGSGTAVKARQFDANGVAVGDEYRLNTEAAGNQAMTDIATLADGRVLATWISSNGWDSEIDLKAQFLYTSPNSAPQITSSGGATSASFTLAENETAVTTVAAADSDGPQAVTYWIGGGADAGLFAIDKTTGALSFAAGPDFESPADADEDGVYHVIVEARDGLSVDTQAVSVAVTDLADGLSFRYTSLTALENGLAGPTLLALGGYGAPVSYTIVGGADSALLALDAQTGELSFLAEQDREAPGDADGDGVYQVEVTADDGASSVTRTISVALGNVNEGQVFLTGTEWTVAENEYLAATVVAADIDGDVLEYGVIGGADGWLFEIGSEGFLGFSEPADFEAPLDADGDNVYEVEVIAYDGDLYTTQLLTITVTDAEDPVSPAFARTAFEVSEIVHFSAALELTGGGVDVYYSIVGGADSWLFNIDSYTGELSMIFGAFDYESPYDSDGDNLYQVRVEAYDYNTHDAVTGTVTVAVRDAVNEELFFVTDDDWAAAENETYVGAVTAYDAQYDALTYSVTGGADGALFTIVAETGELFFLAAPVIGAPGDADGDNVYELEVAVTDGMSTEYQLLTVTLGEVGEPGFAQTAFTTDENQEASALLVPSADGDWTYSISGGADAGQFVLDTVTGEITFLGGDFEGPYDYDGDNVYEVEVTADSGGDAVTGLVTFEVQNVNEGPTFPSSPYWWTPENSTWLGYVASDPEGDPLSFSVTGGADAQRFALDEPTGLLSFVSAPDFEAPADANGDNVYEIAVTVTDGVFTANETLFVSVGDVWDTLTFQKTVFSAAENGTAVGPLRVDSASNGIVYQITGGADAQLFTIGGTSSNRQLTFLTAQDFENPGDADGDGVYEVQVKATFGSATATETMFVTLTDRAEAPVIVSNGGGNFGSAAVNEGGTAVTTVIANDPDGSPLFYAIAGGPDAARFAIDEATGALAFVTAPDFEAPGDADANNTYEVTVRASDGSLSDTQTLFVHVGDGNDAPVITSNGGGAVGSVAISENSTAVTTVAATDAEGGVSYSIGGGADAALFAIDAATGALGFIAATDFEAPGDADGDNIYDVVVSASDGSQSDTQALAISVGNVNEAPVIVSNGGAATATLTTGENETAVTTVAAEDSEGGVVYAIVGGSDAALFMLDAATGALAFLEPQDFESPGDANGDGVYEVVVGADDGTFSDTQALSVTLSDVNEAPVIMSGANVNNENFTTAGGVWASDPDGDQLSYSIAGGADGHLFLVNFQGGAELPHSAGLRSARRCERRQCLRCDRRSIRRNEHHDRSDHGDGEQPQRSARHRLERRQHQRQCRGERERNRGDHFGCDRPRRRGHLFARRP